MALMVEWQHQTWRIWRRWRFYYRHFTAVTTIASTAFLVVLVVVVMVGWNALLLLPSTEPLHHLDQSYGGGGGGDDFGETVDSRRSQDSGGGDGVSTTTTTTTTGAAYVRTLKMDWRRRWTLPWASKERKEGKKRTRKRKMKKEEEEKKKEEEEGEEEDNNNSYNYSTSQGCEGYRVGFAAEGSILPVALASYPGSGNTWLRGLLEEATGVFTGSTYDDQHLYVTGLFGELEPWSAGTTLTQKTHSASPSVTASFKGRAVLLVRNPYRALLAYHNYLFGGHLGYAPVSNYRSKDWGAFVHMQARAWMDMTLNWTRLTGALQKEEEEEEENEDLRKEEQLTKLKKEDKEAMKKTQKEGVKETLKEAQKEEGRRVAVVHYEELLQDPVTPLLPALDVLPVPAPSPARLACLERHHRSRRRFKRKQEYLPQGLEIFSPTDRDKLDRAIRYVDYHLRRLHLAPLPLHLYEYYNNTPPDTQKTTRVPCLEGETIWVCDARVDELNAAWRRRKRKRGGKENEQSPSPVDGRGGGGGDSEEEEEEEWKKDPLERFAGTKMGLFLTQGFTTFMKQLRGDPLQQMARRSTDSNP